MPSTNDYLDALRAKMQLRSDSALARALAVSRQTISHYRHQGISMDDDIAARAAELLEIHPGTVLLDMYRERTRDPKIKDLWADIGTVFRCMAPPPRLAG